MNNHDSSNFLGQQLLHNKINNYALKVFAGRQFGYVGAVNGHPLIRQLKISNYCKYHIVLYILSVRIVI